MLEPLPIDAAISDIHAALDRAHAVVIVADPGAGKTTRVPPALVGDGPVILLQPRRAAARSIARRIALERGWTLGHEVGWHIRLERRFDASTRLLVATEGILTARLQQDALLSEFRTIVLDEFHERSIYADLAIALSRQAMRARDDLRLVVMSATIDADRVSAYLDGCPIVRVPGRLHPLRIEYAPSLDIGDAASRMLNETTGDVLCFEPGAREIEAAIAQIQARVSPSIDVLPLHGSLSSPEQDRALTSPGAARRVIVATNIAETSVTVPRVTGVVDRGVEKVARYDAGRAIDRLVVERISQAAADQRSGRAGRLSPGLVYRLWNATDRLRPFRDPDIRRVDLSGVVLDVLAWGGDPGTLDWFEPPPADALAHALNLLQRLDAVRGLVLTDTGRRMQRLPLPPRLSRIVCAAGGARRAIRACAILAEPRPIPQGTASTTSDLLSALDRWSALPDHVKQAASDIERCYWSGGGRPPAEESETEFRRAVFAGYPDRVAQRREAGSDRLRMASGTGARLAKESGVRDAAFLVALDLRSSAHAGDPDNRVLMASAVDERWLEPTSSDVAHRIDDRGAVRAVEVVTYDALILAERVVAPDPAAAADLLARAFLGRPLPDADVRLLRRARFAGVEIDLPALVHLAAVGARSLNDLGIARVLPFDSARAIDRDAPESIVVPSGRRAVLDYAEDGGVSAAVKLQELFGMAESPRVGPRREPVLLSLLAPNGRPVQMTRDLRSFWDRTYPEVRRELRGRYPKHPWPEDPWSATPTARAKPRRT